MADSLPEHPPKAPLPMRDDRIWIDGCFDFAHHGHAGAILQAKRLGTYLIVGVHSDASILENKGPTVMNLSERLSSVAACRWTNLPVPNAPYVTSPEWLDLYGARYVVHGDDVTTDSNGEDCYRIVKAAGRFKIVKRTPGISTTDLVGRMLLCTKTHHIRDLGSLLLGVQRGKVFMEIPVDEALEMLKRVRDYASDAAGVPGKGCKVYTFEPNLGVHGSCLPLVDEPEAAPKPGQRVVYVDGGFDLFSSGHIEFLRLVVEAETNNNDKQPPYIIAGIHTDQTINHHKHLNHPIMNHYERALCVLQCRYISAIVLSAPYKPTKSFLSTLPTGGIPSAVYHGPTKFMETEQDPYVEVRDLGVFKEVGSHRWEGVNAGSIVERIVRQREVYEERQRAKMAKGGVEGGMSN